MIFINGTFQDATHIIGPWTTDQEIEEMIRSSKKQTLTPQGLRELRTACREHLAQADRNYRSPYTTQ